ncbi:MAG TPA: hypothetical protein VMG59_12140 [Phycisphaerae bacterium]|nr:hypothetical protein [Phycisphaerae bacterium]
MASNLEKRTQRCGPDETVSTVTATPQASPITPLAVGAADAAKLCGISRSTWLAQFSAGQTPLGFWIARRHLWLIDELRDWLAAGAPSRDKWERIKKE